MNNSFSFTNTILNVFFERICKPINFLSIKLNSSTPLWDEPIKMYEKIEKYQLEVDSVIVEAKKYSAYFNGERTPRLYHALLCRVYILVYYKHRDDPLYQEIVVPRLRDNMGIYSSQHLKTINEEIDKILRQEEMIKKANQEKMAKETEQTFAKAEVEQMMHSQNDHVAQLEKELNEAQKRISELEVQINDSQQKDNEEVERLRTVNAQLSEKVAIQDEWYTGEFDNLSIEKDMVLRERVIFFATVLSLDLDKKYIVLSNLAKFISEICNDQKNVGPFLSRMKKPEEAAANAKAAKKVAGLMKVIIPEEYRSDKHLKINQLVESMLLNFPEKED